MEGGAGEALVVGVDLVLLMRPNEQERECKPGTVEAPTSTANVLAQMHTVLTPALADAIVPCAIASKCLHQLLFDG
jgi:hypothetical protein